MGGSNPKELIALGAPDDDRIKHLPGLHAKVYLSDRGLITSSANASNNGIGFLAVASLIEAGTFHAPGSEAYRSASRWFENIWNIANVVDATALVQAQRAWNRKPRGSDVFIDGRAPNPKSLFDVVAANPSQFRGVGFAFTSGEETAKARDETAAAIIAKDEALDLRILSESEEHAIRAWPVGDVFSEWEPEDIHAWPERFICAHLTPNGNFSYWFYERVHTVVLENGRGMVLARRPRGFRASLGFGAAPMAQADADRASLIFKSIGEAGHKLYESVEKLTEQLAELPHSTLRG